MRDLTDATYRLAFLRGETGVRWSGSGYRDHNSPLGNEKVVDRDKNREEVKGSRDGVSGWSLEYETSRAGTPGVL